MFIKNIEYISSETLEGLRRKLQRISGPFTITHMYHDGKKHIAWIRPDRPFTANQRRKLERD